MGHLSFTFDFYVHFDFHYPSHLNHDILKKNICSACLAACFVLLCLVWLCRVMSPYPLGMRFGTMHWIVPHQHEIQALLMYDFVDQRQKLYILIRI